VFAPESSILEGSRHSENITSSGEVAGRIDRLRHGWISGRNGHNLEGVDMPKSATKAAVEAAMKPPEYRQALKRISQIPGLKKTAAEKAKKIGDVHSACEQMHGVSTVATKFFANIMALDHAEQLTIFRDINGLMTAHGVPMSGADLVDKAQDNVVDLRFPEGSQVETVVEEADYALADEVGDLEDDAGNDEMVMTAPLNGQPGLMTLKIPLTRRARMSLLLKRLAKRFSRRATVETVRISRPTRILIPPVKRHRLEKCRRLQKLPKPRT